MTNSRFFNKTIVVTGAASGIGQRTAQLLVQEGAKVIGLDRHPLADSGMQFIQVDMADPASIEAAVAGIGGPVHGLCNIAGIPGTAPDSVLARVNYLGLRHLTLALLPRMDNGAAIVNLASMAGHQWKDRASLLWELAHTEDWAQAEAWIADHPVMFDQAYRKFKEALIVWSMSKANEWKTQRGIRMNCVSPGPVETPIFNDFKVSLGQQNVADIIDRTGRAATPDDIARAVVFLLSDDARWIVGIDLPTEGGLTSSRFVTAMTAASEVGGKS